MLQNLKNKRQEGFTIIEVMIVLVIAAVILLIVFLAVPALQRNSRNTQANNEAAAVSAAASEYVSNNNGTVPSTAAELTAASTAIAKLANVKNLTTVTASNGTATALSPTSTTAYVVFGKTCPTTVTGSSVTPATGTARQMAVIFAVEDTSSTPVAKCTSSGV